MTALKIPIISRRLLQATVVPRANVSCFIAQTRAAMAATLLQTDVAAGAKKDLSPYTFV
jgi:hypothetical protein